MNWLGVSLGFSLGCRIFGLATRGSSGVLAARRGRDASSGPRAWDCGTAAAPTSVCRGDRLQDDPAERGPAIAYVQAQAAARVEARPQRCGERIARGLPA